MAVTAHRASHWCASRNSPRLPESGRHRGKAADALATVRLLRKTEDQAQVTGSIAWGLAHNGNFVQALALVESAADGQNKGVAYEGIAELRAEAGDLEDALQIAHRIRKDPDRLSDTLVRLASRRACRRSFWSA